MIAEDGFLLKIFKMIALIWFILVLILSIFAGLAQKNIFASIQLLLLSTYPYAIAGGVYFIQKSIEQNRRHNEWPDDETIGSLTADYTERMTRGLGIAGISILYVLLYFGLSYLVQKFSVH